MQHEGMHGSNNKHHRVSHYWIVTISFLIAVNGFFRLALGKCSHLLKESLFLAGGGWRSVNKMLVFSDMRLLWRQCSSSQSNANIKGTQEKDNADQPRRGRNKRVPLSSLQFPVHSTQYVIFSSYCVLLFVLISVGEPDTQLSCGYQGWKDTS